MADPWKELNDKVKSSDAVSPDFASNIQEVIAAGGIKSSGSNTFYSIPEIRARFVQSEFTGNVSALPRSLRSWIPNSTAAIGDRKEHLKNILLSASSALEILNEKSQNNAPLTLDWDKGENKFLSELPDETDFYEVVLSSAFTFDENGEHTYYSFKKMLLDYTASIIKHVTHLSEFDLSKEQTLVFLNSLRLVMLGTTQSELRSFADQLGIELPQKDERINKKERRSSEKDVEENDKTEYVDRKVLIESTDYSKEVENKIKELEKIKQNGWIESTDLFTTGARNELVWQKVFIGEPLSSEHDSQLYRGYFMISPEDLIKCVTILEGIGLSNKADVHMKWLINYRNNNTSLAESLGGRGHYAAFPPEDPMIVIYGDKLEDILKVLNLVAQHPESESIEKNRRAYLEDTYKVPPRRPGVNRFSDEGYDADSMLLPGGATEYTFICYNSDPGTSEARLRRLAKSDWRAESKGTDTQYNIKK